MTLMAVRLLLAVVLVWLALPTVAHADRPFSARFSTNTQGAIAIASNSIESCLDALPACANVRNAVGGAVAGNNNNNRTMTWVDVDGDPATFDSSSADLTLPAGVRVLFAGLYYGGRLSAGQGGAPPPNPGARNTVLFKAPADTAYRSLTASQVDDSSTQYQGFVNVTGIVDAGGPGSYTTANVQLGTGLSDSGSGGWALVVAYGDAAAPSRNLSVFDGMQTVTGNGTVTIPLGGFQTPLSGPVTSTVGLVAYEGDLGTLGDGAAIQGGSGAFTGLSNAVNPGPPATSASNSNVFNSTISNAGALVTSRSPSFQNNLGYDADLFSTTGVLGNNQSSTQVRLSTSGDAYQPGVVTIATDLYAPRITATKAVDSATASLGDTLTYTVNVQNTGQDGATGTTFSDLIPQGAVFVPGSITLNGGTVSDAADGDAGEFAGGRVVVRLGTLAPTTGSATVSFRVTVATAGLASGATIENTADLAFQAATTGIPSAVTTAPATTAVLVPDLAIGKTHAPDLAPGQTSTYTVTVANVGEGPTSGPVTVTDTIETGMTLTGPATGTGWTCSTSGATITCTHPDVLAAGSEYPPISIPVLVGTSTPPGQLSNTATLQAPSDGNPDNNSVTDSGAVSEPVIDLHVEKVVTSTPDVTPAGYLTGETVTYRIEVTNNGIADAANVELAETFDAALIVESITPSQGSCSGTVCNLGTITPGQAPVTIIVEATLPPGLDGGAYPNEALLDNTATVSAPVGIDINPDDNSASATISTIAYADISLTKSFSPEQPAAGGPVTYTMTVRNDGPGTVDVFFGDNLHAALQKPPTAISISGGTGVCRFDPTGESIGAPPGSDFPIVACDIPQFGPGEERVITIQSTLAPDSAGTEVSNFAFAGAVVPFTDLTWDPDNFADNSDEVAFTPGTVDVGIEKTRVGSGTVPVGGEVLFRLVARNWDDPEAVPGTGIEVRDTLPAGLTPVAAGAGCTIDGQQVVCRIDELGPGEQRAFEVRARAEPSAAGQTLTNRGTVTVLAADPDPDDDTSDVSVTVGPLPAAASPPPVQVVTECRSKRRIVIRVRERAARLVRSATIRVDGRRIKVKRRRSDGRLVAVIDLRGLPKDTYRVVITARLRDGRRVRWVRSYRTCIGALPPSNRLDNPRAL